jgi:hypothetical protein
MALLLSSLSDFSLNYLVLLTSNILLKESKLRLTYDAISSSYIMCLNELNVRHPVVLLTMNST